MTSLARSAFREGIEAFSTAVDLQTVRASDPVGDFLRRGLTVAGYNLLETYLMDRITEIAPFISGGATQFLDLPERMQRRAITQPLQVGANMLRNSLRGAPIAELRSFSQGFGASLSAVSRSLELSPLTWLWTGSNMNTEDFADSLRYFHVAKPWESVRSLGHRIGFPEKDFNGDLLNLKEELGGLANERHKCAHVASYGVTTIWIRALPSQLLKYAICFDIFASLGAFMIRSGDKSYFADHEWLDGQQVEIRFVRQRKSDYGEIKENASRASFKGADGDALFAAAARRCGDLEVLIRQDLTGAVTDWSIPALDF